MDQKEQKILTDECSMTDAIPGEMKTGSVFAEEYVKYIRELQNEFRLWKNQAERGQLTTEDVGLLCKEMLLKNVRTRSSLFWAFSGKTKKEMTKNRLRYLFLSMLEGHLKGESVATNSMLLWVESV